MQFFEVLPPEFSNLDFQGVNFFSKLKIFNVYHHSILILAI